MLVFSAPSAKAPSTGRISSRPARRPASRTSSSNRTPGRPPAILSSNTRFPASISPASVSKQAPWADDFRDRGAVAHSSQSSGKRLTSGNARQPFFDIPPVRRTQHRGTAGPSQTAGFSFSARVCSRVRFARIGSRTAVRSGRRSVPAPHVPCRPVALPLPPPAL